MLPILYQYNFVKKKTNKTNPTKKSEVDKLLHDGFLAPANLIGVGLQNNILWLT